MRLIAFFMVGAGCWFFYSIIIVWRDLCYARNEFIPLSLTDFSSLIASLGVLVAKAHQKKFELCEGHENQDYSFFPHKSTASPSNPSVFPEGTNEETP
jgi:hypothetical protein